MSLTYSVTTPDGQATDYNSSEIAQQLQSAGYQNLVVNPDGKSVSYSVNGQTYDDDIPSLLETLGHKVAGAVPTEADESFIQPAWRAEMETLPSDDNVRKGFLKSKLAKMGMDIKDDQITGSGSDWFFHNPQTGKWYATTNAKGFDVSDLAGLAGEAPAFLGSVAGGGIGAAGGSIAGPVGSVAGGFAGAAAGDFAGRRLARGALSLFDEDYDKAAPKNVLPSREELTSAGLSGIGGGIGGVPALAKLLNKGAASALLRPAGEALGAAGTVAKTVAGKAADSPLATGLITSAIPGLGTAQGAGLVLRAGELPVVMNRLAAKGGAKLASFADNALAGGVGAEEEALFKGLRNTGANIEDAARALEFTPPDTSKLGKINRAIFGGLDNTKAVEEGASAVNANKNAVSAFYNNLGRRRFSNEVQKRAAQSADPQAFLQKAAPLLNKNAGVRGMEQFGKVAQAASKTGRALEGGAEGITRMGLRGIENAGRAAEGVGKIVGTGARYAAPWESRILLNQGAQQLDDGYETLQQMMQKRKSVPAFSR